MIPPSQNSRSGMFCCSIPIILVLPRPGIVGGRPMLERVAGSPNATGRLLGSKSARQCWHLIASG